MQKTALLAGATGLVGSALLPLLLASDRYAKVIVVGRRPVALAHPKLVQVTTELSQLEAVRLRLIADDVYCCLGTTQAQAGSKAAFYAVDFSGVVQLAALTAANFAARFLVVSSLGAAPDSRVYYSRVKGEMEAAVRQFAVPGHSYFSAFAAAGHPPPPPPGRAGRGRISALGRAAAARLVAQLPGRGRRHRGPGHAPRRRNRG